MAHNKFSQHYLRLWSLDVRERDVVCQRCGSKEELEAHHIYSKSYYPELAYAIVNGVALCGNDKEDGMHCHSFFHNDFMEGTRKKCTFKDWEKFIHTIKWSQGFVHMRSASTAQLEDSYRKLEILRKGILS